MDLIKAIKRYIKAHHVIALIGGIIIIATAVQYSHRKSSSKDALNAMSTGVETAFTGEPAGFSAGVDAADFDSDSPEQREKFYRTASGASDEPVHGVSAEGSYAPVDHESSGLAPACQGAQPSELLPKDGHHQTDMGGINLLQAGHHAGINTVGGALRNANLQVRSEPPNPTDSVGPWNKSTIAPDLMRVPLEIGCGPQ